MKTDQICVSIVTCGSVPRVGWCVHTSASQNTRNPSFALHLNGMEGNLNPQPIPSQQHDSTTNTNGPPLIPKRAYVTFLASRTARGQWRLKHQRRRFSTEDFGAIRCSRVTDAGSIGSGEWKVDFCCCCCCCSDSPADGQVVWTGTVCLCGLPPTSSHVIARDEEQGDDCAGEQTLLHDEVVCWSGVLG